MANGATDRVLLEISGKLNVLIALSLRNLIGERQLSAKGKRKKGVGELIHYLADLGLEAEDIAVIVGSPLASVRTLLTPSRRK